jgi:hypothetical protein
MKLSLSFFIFLFFINNNLCGEAKDQSEIKVNYSSLNIEKLYKKILLYQDLSEASGLDSSIIKEKKVLSKDLSSQQPPGHAYILYFSPQFKKIKKIYCQYHENQSQALQSITIIYTIIFLFLIF